MINLDLISQDINLETKRLILRKPQPDDINDIFEYASDETVAHFTRFDPHKSKEETKMFLITVNQKHLNKTDLVLLLELKDEKKIIGSISFQNILEDSERAEIGFALSKKYWSRGLMSEAFNKMIEFGFKKIKFNRLESFCNIENIRSNRLLNTFMQKEGVLRERDKIKGRFVSSNVFSILRKDYILSRPIVKSSLFKK